MPLTLRCKGELIHPPIEGSQHRLTPRHSREGYLLTAAETRSEPTGSKVGPLASLDRLP
jgi:hypothetical protein